MLRAGVFIGVDRTGNLHPLRDAAAGAKRMHDWAVAQGMKPLTQAKLITDADGKVTLDRIYDAIKEIIDGPGADQLILYFAGHGVNINRSEHWLLTDAPVKPGAAVNVSGSVELARYCGIGHVAIFSDACRVAPEGIQAQNVRGVDIFPNVGTGDRAMPVDQFFACLLGRTAAETSDPAVAAGNFRALYTDVLLDALHGNEPDILEPSDLADDAAYYVRPVKLESYLEREVPTRVLSMKLETKVNQNPDAILAAHSHWLSRVPPPRKFRGGKSSAYLRPAISIPGDLRPITATLLQSAIEGPSRLTAELARIAVDDASDVRKLTETVEQVVLPFGPDHFETKCGINVRGTQILRYLIPGAEAELIGPDVLRIHLNHGAVSTLLRFRGNIGILIPAVAGFVTTVTIQGSELVDVTYEPSSNTSRWNEFVSKASEIRALRAVAASASQQGRFRLRHQDASLLAPKMQYLKGIDPTLAIYAAYAYHDLQATDRIREMSRLQREDLGVTFFDLALLGRNLVNKAIDRSKMIVPFVPLLSQGWSLLTANRVQVHRALDGIEETMCESVWSVFNERGLDKIENALQSGEVL